MDLFIQSIMRHATVSPWPPIYRRERLALHVHTLFDAPHGRAKNAPTLTAYLDESQHESDSKHVVVADFCGSEEEW